MRRQTLVMLILLFVLIVVTAIVQFTMSSPGTPFVGPSSPGQLPSLSASP